MTSRALSPMLICLLVATQIVGSATSWAAGAREIKIDESRRVVIAAVSGKQLTVLNQEGSKPLRFRDVVHVQELLTTGNRTQADFLIGDRAVVSMGSDTALQLLAVNPEQTTIQVTQGMARVAAARSVLGSQSVVTLQTPTGRVQMHSGIVRVQVEPAGAKAKRQPMGEAYAHRVSSISERMAAASPLDELIQVDEGTAEILQNGEKSVTLQAGQRVVLQGGKAGSLSESVNQDSIRSGVVATAGHSQTSKEGRDYLVALQIDQATQLTDQLIGSKRPASNKTESGAADKKGDTKNVINGATGGVALQNNLVSALFGTGSAAHPSASVAQDRTGSGFGGIASNDSIGGVSADFVSVKDVEASVHVNDPKALLVFTRKDPIETGVVDERSYTPRESLPSNFVVAKELVLLGGTPNEAHGGAPPTQRLIIRGLTEGSVESFGSPVRNNAFQATDRRPSINDQRPAPDIIVAANNNFVVEKTSVAANITISEDEIIIFTGGTLGQYSNRPDQRGFAINRLLGPNSLVDGAITATTDPNRSIIILTGGVSLDQGTTATIGTTAATDTYFKDLNTNLGRKFNGSLLSVITGPNSTPTVVTMQDRMLGVYDGSKIEIEGSNKALLSVLDAKLKGPVASGLQAQSIPLIDIAAGSHATRNYDLDPDGIIRLTPGNNLKFKDDISPGSPPNVTVTSALVTRSTTSTPLDGALLEASAPLFALTSANPCTNTTVCTTMTTTSHFADLAGNATQSLNLDGALVALNASKLVINSGHLLNLNSATAAIGGYLFSLTNGSQLDIKNGALFSLNNNASLTLNGNAFGVFGGGSSTVTIDNNLCGAGAVCGALVNSLGQAITLQDGTALKVAGVTQDVVLPNGFNAFALASGATASSAKIDIDANDALFHIDPTSTLTINGTKVK